MAAVHRIIAIPLPFTVTADDASRLPAASGNSAEKIPIRIIAPRDRPNIAAPAARE